MVIRPAVKEDADTLAAFRCSTGPWYEQEVESFIRWRAVNMTAVNYRLLLAFDNGRLVCCMAHHLERLLRGEKDDQLDFILATRLHLLAIAVEDQGRRLYDGTRFSDMLMATLMADALETREAVVLTAVVAMDNLRSMALCKRHGLRSQVRYDIRHARLSGHFAPR
jgi:hypothetical protein